MNPSANTPTAGGFRLVRELGALSATETGERGLSGPAIPADCRGHQGGNQGQTRGTPSRRLVCTGRVSVRLAHLGMSEGCPITRASLFGHHLALASISHLPFPLHGVSLPLSLFARGLTFLTHLKATYQSISFLFVASLVRRVNRFQYGFLCVVKFCVFSRHVLTLLIRGCANGLRPHPVPGIPGDAGQERIRAWETLHTFRR